MSEKLYRVITSISLVVIALAVCTGTYCIYAGQGQGRTIPAPAANMAPTTGSAAENSLSEIASALKQLEFGIRVHGIRVDRP